MIINVFLLLLCTALSAPTDGPVRVDLSISDWNGMDGHNNLNLKKHLEPENHPTVQTTPKVYKIPAFRKQDSLLALFNGPPTTREDALQETEGWGSKTLSLKENVQNKFAGIFQPKPIVDTITESEKYGNTGQKFEGVGSALVGAAQTVSNFVNVVIAVPNELLTNALKATSEKLNNLGGKLIGL